MSGIPSDRLFYYCKFYVDRVLENTKTWLHHMSSYGQIDNDFVVYVGLLSRPEDKDDSLISMGSPYRSLTHVRILNTCIGQNDGYRLLAEWFPKNIDCNMIGLKEFIHQKLGIPVENQILYRDGNYLTNERSILKLLFEHEEDCPVDIQLAFKEIPLETKNDDELSFELKTQSIIQDIGLQKLS